jgi:ATP-binding cassette subfamily C protein CydD
MKVLRISFLSSFALELAATISVALIAVTIGLRLVDGQISFLKALTVLLLAPEVYFPLRNAAALFHASADGKEALDEIARIASTIEGKPAPSQKTFKKIKSISWTRSLIKISPQIQAEVDGARIRPGEIVFIQGVSGSGKTTFAQSLLAQRFDLIIQVETEDAIHNLELGDQLPWLRHVGWVSQSPQFAPGTIREQFLVCEAELSDGEISDLLGSCGLAISDLTDGLSTSIGGIGEKTDQVSGGQLRKIALARALAKRPQVLIVDEPTADCDDDSAETVMQRLREGAAEGLIVIAITHDISLLNANDKSIFVGEAISVEHR